jgi:hypothetical protein
MKPNTQLMPFCGYPIVKVPTGELLYNNELNFLKGLDTREQIEHIHNSPKISFRITKGVHILDSVELLRVRDFIWNNFCEYVDDILEIENQFYMCNSWATFQKKVDFHDSHQHTNAIYSVVFYVEADEDSLEFTSPQSKIHEGFNFSYNVKNYNVFNSRSWRVPVKTGDMVIFPGIINHGSTIHQSDTDRILIAASFFMKGEIGKDYNYNAIKIADANDR